MKTQFICFVIASTLILAMSESLGQPGQQDNWAGHRHSIGGARFHGRRIGAARTPVSSSVSQPPQHTVPRSILQGVRHRVPQDYSSIQAAISASNDGDTVLVSEGTYKENIRYQGKAITVGSLYLTDGDTTHIAKTIIDGSGSTQPDSGSVVYFISGEDTTSELCGFTIQGGYGTRVYFSYLSSSAWVSMGGGIYSLNAGPRIFRNIITRNRVVAQVAASGGIEAIGTRSHLPYMLLDSNRISDNYVESDAGSGALWGFCGGADIEMNARIVGNVFERDSVAGNLGAEAGGLALGANNPDSSLVSGYIAGNVLRSNFLSANIQGAVGAGMIVYSTAVVTILNNLFDSNTARSISPVGWAGAGGLLVDDQYLATGYGRKMVMGNQFLNNTADCQDDTYGGGLWLYYTTATVNANMFRNNATIRPSDGGAGLYIQNSAFSLENNIITGNVSAGDGGGVYVLGAPQVGTEETIINNTIVGNRAASNGGGLRVNGAPSVVSLNNIFWNDTSSSGPEIYGSIAALEYCDVKGGYVGTGNINSDPAFVAGDSLFHLSSSSPCIQGGTDSIQIGAAWYYAPVTDYGGLARPMPKGTRPDIGAREEQFTNGVNQRTLSLPTQVALMQNYPNPFNPSTTIQYALPRRTQVTLSIYNTLGQLVSTIVNGEEQAGYHEVRLDGTGLSSGVYFYRLTAGSFVQTRKLLLLK